MSSASPLFLKSGVTTACLNSFGKVEFSMHVLKSLARNGDIAALEALRIFDAISVTPADVPKSSLLISFSIIVLDVGRKENSEKRDFCVD